MSEQGDRPAAKRGKDPHSAAPNRTAHVALIRTGSSRMPRMKFE